MSNLNSELAVEIFNAANNNKGSVFTTKQIEDVFTHEPTPPKQEPEPQNKPKPKPMPKKDLSNLIKDFEKYLKSKRLYYNETVIQRFVCALASKPFLILTGNSGTGKTKIAIEFAEWISKNEEQFKIIPVGSDWTDNRPVLGFVNPLKNEPEYHSTLIVDLLLKAAEENNKNVPFFIILDEMNLSHVERYFSDFLSVMESEKKIPLHKHNGIKDTTGKVIPGEIPLPPNVFIVGTVNIDETTYMFSPKVLDRANVIEFRTDEKGIDDYPFNYNDGPVSKGYQYGEGFLSTSVICRKEENIKDLKILNELKSELKKVFEIMLKKDQEFGYRTLKEAYSYALANEKLVKDKDKKAIIDEIIIQRVLPKLNGSRGKLEELLEELIEFCVNYNLSTAKLEKMKEKLKRDQFVSFI